MTEERRPEQTRATPSPNYLGAVVGLVLIAAVFILLVLYIRPNLDPMTLMSAVIGSLVPTIAAVLAYMKSQETHLSVNSQLDAWKKEFARMVRAETTVAAAKEAKVTDGATSAGVAAGIESERQRAEKKP